MLVFVNDINYHHHARRVIQATPKYDESSFRINSAYLVVVQTVFIHEMDALTPYASHHHTFYRKHVVLIFFDGGHFLISIDCDDILGYFQKQPLSSRLIMERLFGTNDETDKRRVTAKRNQ